MNAGRLARIFLFLVVGALVAGCEYGPFKTQQVRLADWEASLPDDTFYADEQWYLDMIGAPDAWGLYESLLDGNRSIEVRRDLPLPQPVAVAVIDTGIDAEHPELRDVLGIGGVNVVGTSVDYIPTGGYQATMSGIEHGTHVAGLVGARAGNSFGISGVAFNRDLPVPIRIAGVRALADIGPSGGTLGDLIEGILYAAGAVDGVPRPSLPVQVINMSLGGSFTNTQDIALLESALEVAAKRDIVMVAAAGNKGLEDGIEWPAKSRHVIAVGAVDFSAEASSSERSSFSDFGKEIEIMAPGAYASTVDLENGLLSTWPGSAFQEQAGTSMATPLVAGAVAMIRSVNPGLSAAEVRSTLRDTTLDLNTEGFDMQTGYGLLQIDAALQAAAESPFGYPLSSSALEERQSRVGTMSADELRTLFLTESVDEVEIGPDLFSLLVYVEADADYRETFGSLGLSVEEAIQIGNLSQGTLVRVDVSRWDSSRIRNLLVDLQARDEVLLAVPDRPSVSSSLGPTRSFTSP